MARTTLFADCDIRSRTTFWALTALASVTVLVLSALDVRLAGVSSEVFSLHQLAVTASVFGFLASPALILGVYVVRNTSRRAVILVAWLVAIALCLTTSILTLAAMGLAAHLGPADSDPHLAAWHAGAIAGMAVTLLSAVLQAAVFCFVSPRKLGTTGPLTRTDPYRPRRTLLGCLRSLPWPGAEDLELHDPPLGSRRRRQESAAWHAAQTGHPVVHHSASRTQLLHSVARAPSPIALLTRLHFPINEFESWDAPRDPKPPESPFDSAYSFTRPEPWTGDGGDSPSSTTRLPTRPAPTAAHDGLGSRSPSRPDSPLFTPPDDALPWKDWPLAPRTSPALGGAPEQAHIHPLFREENVVPPPKVSPGTVIVASPHAGKVLKGRSASMQSLRSLPSSASLRSPPPPPLPLPLPLPLPPTPPRAFDASDYRFPQRGPVAIPPRLHASPSLPDVIYEESFLGPPLSRRPDRTS